MSEWWKDDKAMAALTLLVGAPIGWVANAWRNRKLDRATVKRSLSESEAAFRESVLDRLKRSEERTDSCEQQHQECREHNLSLQSEVNELKDKVADLESLADQGSLKLEGHR